MTESFKNISQKAGMPPGVMVHVGHVHQTESRITLIDFSADTLVEKSIESVNELLEYKESKNVTWVNVEGLSDVAPIESIGKLFGIHPLTLEDILNAHQRPRFEETDSYLYIVFKHLSLANEDFAVNYEQISILLFENIVFTFRERQDDLFAPLYKRLQNTKGRLRSEGTDYLTYAIMDLIVDMNFSLLDSLALMTDTIEDELLSNPTAETLLQIQQIKRELIYIRKSVAPLRELLTSVLRSDTALIAKKTHPYFRDIYDHSLHITEEIETYRDILTGLLDIYISSVSNKLNEIMKVLTVFASIFIPLTFFTGVYGMNFQYMPELTWKWAYPSLWAGFVLFSIILVLFFKKKKWV